jgi:hypothetical protein
MPVENAKQDVKVSFGQDFGIIGGDRVEVSPDGKKVTADAKNGFEVKAVSGAATRAPAGALPEISISADFNTVVLNGVTIERSVDGHLVISAPGGIVKQAAPANDTVAKGKTAPRIGELDDGGVYVGLSASSGKPLHAALADLPDYKTYEEALAAAEQLKALHPTARVPTPEELDKNLFENRNTGHLKGTFNTSGWFPYRSSESSETLIARVQFFGFGAQDNGNKDYRLPVRLVW